MRRLKPLPGMRKMNLTQGALLCLLIFQTTSKVAESTVRQELHVQLQQYSNVLNLKYLPQKENTPYCCCANGNTCFASIDADNLNSTSCLAQCKLRFTLCTEIVTEEADTDELIPQFPHCNSSSVQKGFPLIIFDCQSAASEAYLPLGTLRMNEMQNVQSIGLTVTIEEQDDDGYDMVDEIYIPVIMYSFSKSNKYTGIRGIATVTLGYSFITIKGKSNNIEQDSVDLPSASNSIAFTVASPVEVNATKSVFSEGKVTKSPPVTETPSVPLKAKPETITLTRTVTVLATSNSSEGECTESAAGSSSVWMPVSLVILIVAVVLVVTVFIVMSAALCLMRRKKQYQTSDGDFKKGTSAINSVENLLYAVPLSSTTTNTSGVGSTKRKEQGTLAVGIDDALYELPSPSTLGNGQHKSEVFLTESVPPPTHRQERDYLELSSATIPPCDYLCPKESSN